MLVLGIDAATSTGLCFRDSAKPASEWRVFAVEAEGAFGEDKAGDLALFLDAEIKGCRPDFAAMEMPQRSVARFERKGRPDLAGDGVPDLTINPNALQLSAIAGAVVAVLDCHRVPWALIAPATWRSSYFGKGAKPADGDWKALAIRHAEIQRIVLPPTKKAARDAAESVGIATAWAKCTMIPARHHAAFMALRTGAHHQPQLLKETA